MYLSAFLPFNSLIVCSLVKTALSAPSGAASELKNDTLNASLGLLPHDGVIYNDLHVRNSTNQTVDGDIGTITMMNYKYPDGEVGNGYFNAAQLGDFLDKALADIKPRMDLVGAAMDWPLPWSFRYSETAPLPVRLIISNGPEEGVRDISWNDVNQIILTIRNRWVEAYAEAETSAPQTDFVFFVEDLARSIVPIRIGQGSIWPPSAKPVDDTFPGEFIEISVF